MLIFLKASPAVLKTRLAEREGKNGPDDLPVSEAELLRFLKNFQVPSGEGEIVINSEQEFDLDEILKEISKKAEG